VFIAGLVYPTNIVTLLLAGGVLCLLPEQSEASPKRVFLAGVLWGLGALTVPAVLATAAIAGVWLMYWNPGRRIALASVLFLGLALTIVPWMMRDYRVYGRVVPVEPRIVEHLPKLRLEDKDLRRRKIDAILQYPGKYAARFGKEFLHFWQLYPDRVLMAKPGFREKAHKKDQRVVTSTIFSTNNLIMAVSILSTGPLFFFAIFGIAAMWFQQELRRYLALLCGTILSFAVAYSFFSTQVRYRIPIEPYIVILSAYGLKKSWDLLAARLAHRAPVEGNVEAVG
jgi:hypothetical protein